MENRIIANIKTLGIDMIHEAQSGHPGIVLGAAPILYTLYAKHIHLYKNEEKWANRDRFILSAGHGSALLYATLYMGGLGYQVEDLKKFRQLDSKTTGHPEYGVSPFVEATTGPLGQGVAMGVGMALGEKIIKEKFSTKGNATLFDYFVYVLCGDGDLMEGISTEAASFAGTMKLNNLIVLYDSNQISLDGRTDITFCEDVLLKFKALGWDTFEVINGESVEEIDEAIKKAKTSQKPSLIKVNTKIGRGSLLEDSHKVHGKPLSVEDITRLKAKLNIPNAPFYIDHEAKQFFENEIYKRSEQKWQIFQKNVENFKKENESKKVNLLEKFLNNDPISFDLIPFQYGKEAEATRISNGKIINQIAKFNEFFIGGSADLSSSTMTHLQESSNIQPTNYNGQNVWFGVREHAMGAILNGLALSGFYVFGSTFLVFSDYLKPAIRLSSMMNLPVTYIFTHDSVEVGEDGPTHEPIEQIPSLRAIPNLDVFRPCDSKEIIGTWKLLLKNQNPAAILLSRGTVDLIEGSDIDKVAMGAYIVQKEKNVCDGTILASGTEVSKAIEVAEMLYKEEHLDFRVVSMPCLERFRKLKRADQKKILGEKNIFVVEASSSLGLEGLASSFDHLITIDTFGKSGKKEDILHAFGFTNRQIKDKIKNITRGVV